MKAAVVFLAVCVLSAIGADCPAEMDNFRSCVIGKVDLPDVDIDGLKDQIEACLDDAGCNEPGGLWEQIVATLECLEEPMGVAKGNVEECVREEFEDFEFPDLAGAVGDEGGAVGHLLKKVSGHGGRNARRAARRILRMLLRRACNPDGDVDEALSCIEDILPEEADVAELKEDFRAAREECKDEVSDECRDVRRDIKEKICDCAADERESFVESIEECIPDDAPRQLKLILRMGARKMAKKLCPRQSSSSSAVVSSSSELSSSSEPDDD